MACTKIDRYGTEGGDLTVGDGWVWYRGFDQLVAQVDPGTGDVVARFGAPRGSGSASGGAGWLWITAHDVASVYRIQTGDRPGRRPGGAHRPRPARR